MSHANAALTPRARLRVAQLVVDQGVPIAEVAARFQCSWPTVKRWADRYAAGEPMTDRSSRPHAMPAKTARPRSPSGSCRCGCVSASGPVQLAAHVGVAPSTVHRVLTRCRLNRLAHVDRATGEPVRRYEHDHPGVDAARGRQEAAATSPTAAGGASSGRAQGGRNRAATTGKPKNAHYNPQDGQRVRAHRHRRPLPGGLRRGPRRRDRRHRHRRPAPRGGLVRRPRHHHRSGCCPTTAPPTAPTCGATSAPSSASSTPAPGPTGHRPTARSNASTAPWPTGGATPAATPQRAERREALPAWLHEYNHHRPHTACGNKPPITRLTNLPGQYS